MIHSFSTTNTNPLFADLCNVSKKDVKPNLKTTNKKTLKFDVKQHTDFVEVPFGVIIATSLDIRHPSARNQNGKKDHALTVAAGTTKLSND